MPILVRDATFGENRVREIVVPVPAVEASVYPHVSTVVRIAYVQRNTVQLVSLVVRTGAEPLIQSVLTLMENRQVRCLGLIGILHERGNGLRLRRP